MTLIAKPDLSPLLEDFLQRQRWFAGRDRRVDVVVVKSLIILNDGLPALLHVEAEVIYSDGAAERYQLLVGIDDHTPKANPSLVLGRLNIRGRELVAYDALVDTRLCQVLLDLMAAGADLNGLRFRYSTAPGRGYRAASSRLLDAEQSNTSVVYDERFILKVVRRLEAGVNPDLEVTRLLARQGFSGVAAPVGWIESAESTLAVLKPFFAGSMEGWELALHRTRAWHSGDTAASSLRNLAIGVLSRAGPSTSPPPYAATPATLPGPWPPSGSVSYETDITTERRSPVFTIGAKVEHHRDEAPSRIRVNVVRFTPGPVTPGTPTRSDRPCM